MHFREIPDRLITTILITLLIVSCSDKSAQQVKLSGKLINWGNAQQLLSSDAIEADFGLAQDYLLDVNEGGAFDLQFTLKEPAYFSIGRNKLFLQPGDELSMVLDYRDPEKAKFKGTNAAIQAYLAQVPFPKSGSYLNGGRAITSPDIQQVMTLAKEETKQRSARLAEVDASAEFKNLEALRLRLDEINTLLSFPIYGSFKGYWDANEVIKAELLQPAKSRLNALSQDLMQDNHMEHPNFREMLYDLVEPHLQENGIFSQLSFTAYMQEYDAFGALVKQLELEGLTQENQRLLTAYLNADISADYRAMASNKKNEYAPLLPGQPAIDIQFQDANGKVRRLSEFKGELIYVDLWATWCGPCIDELPALNALEKEYKDQAITFIPLSIDSDAEAWQNYLLKKETSASHEFIINRLKLDPYQLITIPRYLLIDEQFNIITVFAPKPSDPQTRELFNEHL